MVYLQDDFYSTLVGKDENGKRDFLLGQIADLIAYNREDVIEALNSSGVLTKPNASDTKIIDAIAENAGQNQRLQTGLAYLIAMNQGELENASSAGADPVSAISAAVAGIGQAVGRIFGAKQAKTEAEAQADSARMQLASDLLKARQPKSKTGLYVGLAAVGVVLILGIVYLARKK